MFLVYLTSKMYARFGVARTVKIGRPDAYGDLVNDSLVSVDVLALRLFDAKVSFATVVRKTEPFVGRPALPGVLLLEGERLAEAAERALREKAGLATAALGQLVVFDEPSRDPRGATLSVAMWAVATGDAGIEWRPVDEPGDLAFDHAHIVASCRPILARLLWSEPGFTRALMGEKFTVGDAVGATWQLTGVKPDRGNLNKKLASVPGLEHAGYLPGRGRPSKWRWS